MGLEGWMLVYASIFAYIGIVVAFPLWWVFVLMQVFWVWALIAHEK